MTSTELEPTTFRLVAQCPNQLTGKTLLNKQIYDNAVGMATGHGGPFCSSRLKHWLWAPPSLMSDGYEEDLSKGVKRPEREDDNSGRNSAEDQGYVNLLINFPIRLHDHLSTGTIFIVIINDSTAHCLALAAFSVSSSYTQYTDSLDGGSARCKASTYKQHNTN
jgi:hypothetical protein